MSEQTSNIQYLVDRLLQGDESAREELIACTWDRLMRLTRKISHDFPNVRRWEQTEDVYQNASVRLWKALDKVQLNDARHFLRLAAEKIRFELIDLARHYYGPMGEGANHATQLNPAGERSNDLREVNEGVVTSDPSKLLQWAEFHVQVDQLPQEEREVFDLLWYHEVSQDEAAKMIGVNVRTIKRRWRNAKLNLHDRLSNDLPAENMNPN